jgi:(S)-mandelate dehydrogenase
MSQLRLATCHSQADLRECARRALPRMVFDYLDGGSGEERTLRENRTALERVRLVGSAPVNVEERRLDTTLFEIPQGLPLIVGPVGLTSAFYPQGEIVLAKAAAQFGIPYVLSTGASVSLEDLQSSCAGTKWCQLYVPPDESLLFRWMDRALECGYSALQITVDTAAPSRRIRDIRNGFSMPFAWTPRKFLNVASHPQWALRMLRHGTPRLLLWEEAARDNSASTIAERNRSVISAAVDWEVLKTSRRRWPKTLIVKGISDPRQAAKAVECGMDGIVVSNHGGRQLDGAAATIDLLPEVVSAVQGRIPVLIDSGFRNGEDVLKALALGASAVQLGRSVIYGLAAGGLAGACKALQMLSDELDTAMALCGVTRISHIRPDIIRRP